jgi:nitrite reductase/ring-hydroxylating ferredoxin subunit
LSWLTGKLSKLMQERGENIDALARLLGVERSRLKNILSGSAIPNENLLKRLARHFGEAPEEWERHARETEENAGELEVPAGYIKVAALSDIPDGEMKIVFHGLVAVANVEGRLHAFGNVCPHAAGPIGEGFLDGCVVECPWHNGQWDITDGKALTPLATADIPVFEVRVTGGDVEVKLTPAVLAQKMDAGAGPS